MRFISLTRSLQRSYHVVSTSSHSSIWLNSGLQPSLVQWLELEKKWIYPTEIQRKMLAVLMKGKDAIIRSETGSGKSYGYVLHLANTIIRRIETNDRFSSSLVMLPSRELAFQVQDWFKEMRPLFNGEEVTQVLVRGDDISQQTIARRAVTIATPSRLCELLEENKTIVDTIFDNTTIVIADEIDALYKPLSKYAPRKTIHCRNQHPPKGQQFLDIFYGRYRSHRPQSIFLSASLNSVLRNELLRRRYVSPNAAFVGVGSEPNESGSTSNAPTLPSCITHEVISVKSNDNSEQLNNPIYSLVSQFVSIFKSNRPPKYTIFCVPDDANTSRIIEQLDIHSIHARELSSFILERQNCDIIVVKYKQARGIDIPEARSLYIISPDSLKPQDYLHMAGRVGRQNISGRVSTLFLERGPNDRLRIDQMMRHLNVKYTTIT